MEVGHVGMAEESRDREDEGYVGILHETAVGDIVVGVDDMEMGCKRDLGLGVEAWTAVEMHGVRVGVERCRVLQQVVEDIQDVGLSD